MSSREVVLDRIRNSLSDLKTRPEIPEPPQVWAVLNESKQSMKERFQNELEAVKGEFVSCKNIQDAKTKIFDFLKEAGARRIGVLDRPLSREIAGNIIANGESTFQTHFAPENPEEISPEELSRWDASLLCPNFLLSDTGSCLFFLPGAFDRLLSYIAPLCLVVASESMLRENLPHAWTELIEKFGSGQTMQENPRQAQNTGEFLIMTGPSRTADIEKVLILGVHGPKRLVVFLVES